MSAPFDDTDRLHILSGASDTLAGERYESRIFHLPRSRILGRHQRYRDLATRRTRNTVATTPVSNASAGPAAESATRPRSLRRISRASLRRGKGSSGASTPRKTQSGAQPSRTSKTSSRSGGSRPRNASVLRPKTSLRTEEGRVGEESRFPWLPAY